MSTLRECIDRWHAAHPGFQTVLECIAPITVVMAEDTSVKRAARQIGIEPSDYQAHRDAGERWCTWCSGWHAARTPFMSNTSVCKRYWSDYKQSLKDRRSA